MVDTFQELMSGGEKAMDRTAKQLVDATSFQTKQQDERFWRPKKDQAGNGSAIIRFLPEPQGKKEDSAFVKVWYHSFRGPTGLWYIENCLTTLGKSDPVTDHNSKLWAAGDQDAARKMKRILKFISNILVLKDPAAPDNEGKVFLYSYGKTIYNMINNMYNPVIEGDERVNVFHPRDGCDFRLIVRQEDNFPKYTQSAFTAPRPLSKDMKKIKTIWERQYPLQPLLDPAVMNHRGEPQFKTYGVLKGLLNRALGVDEEVVEDLPFDLDVKDDTAVDVMDKMPSLPSTDDSDDESVRYFNELSNLD